MTGIRAWKAPLATEPLSWVADQRPLVPCEPDHPESVRLSVIAWGRPARAGDSVAAAGVPDPSLRHHPREVS